MQQEQKSIKNKKWGIMNKGNASSGLVYGMGFIGAVVYYVQHAETFLMGAVGILKAFAWPAFVIYHLFNYFNF